MPRMEADFDLGLDVLADAVVGSEELQDRVKELARRDHAATTPGATSSSWAC